jgi:hypothetical protein
MPVKNTCSCDYPPGGGGQCEANQLSICRNDGSRCHHECRNPPLGHMSQDELEAWSYTQITGAATRGRLNDAQRSVIRSGRYRDALGHVHTFELPQGREKEDGGQAMT